MPFACTDLLAAQRDALLEGGEDIAIPHVGGGLEPFHAVYRRETCLPPIKDAINADKWRVDAWFAQVKVRLFREDELRRYDADLRCFENVNTPEELAEAEMRAQEGRDSRTTGWNAG
jgi:molybdopterin-guanine dinucleotide biosynthesis protein A